jgi:antitoxin HicB
MEVGLNISYPAIFEPVEDGWLLATFPDVPGAITNGEDYAVTYEMAQDALGIMLENYVWERAALPPRSHPTKDHVVVELSALDSSKLALCLEMAKAKLTKTELAARLGVDEKEARRILAVGHNTKLDTLEAAFRAIGRKLTIQVEAA